ncbi:hypothetical protein GWI33_009095 [Rhynchophorus ferrugineus]|uniref:PID domain-containing protein n=1 Tax=Rhynchophorus ferrugineus TaxID=354439 RepID=A0A834IF21_RHYFE|nr:hypothetical protein GWI33_009095 [Rhynchophorus ferrugineus]
MQTLRKKTSPLKYKNETTRFLGDGVSFKAKLIGILEVSEARGDRMCQEALSDLKMAIRAAGEHKQRITVNIAIDGLRLRDEKTGDCLYHHPVHKISFIAQDMTDSRAFGYIFGSPDTGHRFFGIKTDKAASQVVIAMRDLFQVVFALKKKEIELAKQHLEKSYLPTSPLFSDSSSVSSKPSEKLKSEHKASSSVADSKNSGTAVADLVDLELELNSLQQGLNQMERITPSDPFGSKDDPFGDSFISYPINKLILPPPPSSTRERSSRTSDSSILSTKTPPNTAASVDSGTDSLFSSKTNKEFTFSQDFNSSHEEPSSGDWFTPSFGNRIFEEPAPLVTTESVKDEKHEAAKQEIMSQFDVFTELDPLGTGRSKPYIDKKHFFQELKNPPKKALNELASTSNSSAAQDLFNINFSQTAATKTTSATTTTTASSTTIYTNTTNIFTADPFGEDPFVKEDPFAETDFSGQDPFETEFATQQVGRDLHAIFQNNLSRSPKTGATEGAGGPSSSPRTVQFTKSGTFDDRKSSSEMLSETENAPEPPPRPAATLTLGEIQPPPLPPKKQGDIVLKPPPRPPHTEDNRYDYIEKFEREQKVLDIKSILDNTPPLPVPQRKSKFESDFTTPPERPRKQNQHSSDEDYLTPISFPDSSESPGVLLPPPQRHAKKEQQQAQPAAATVEAPAVVKDDLNNSLEGLDITLSQLTLSGLNDLASKLKIPPHKLSNMTLVQLTNYLSTFIKAQSKTKDTLTADNVFPAFQADFSANFDNATTNNADATYDRYAVFRELQEEIKQTKIDTEPEQIQEEKERLERTASIESQHTGDNKTSGEDKYAALREIVEIEIKQAEMKKDEVNRNIIPRDETLTKEDTLNEDQDKRVEDINLANKEHSMNEVPEKDIISKDCIIEYMMESKETKSATPEKSPSRSPVMKSPVPIAVTDVIQSNARLTSGSLSDVLSGSSPEVDNTGSNSDVPKKNLDPTGESWAIFDQSSANIESKENLGAIQSEEGISPWSSDSKEFGNKSPTDWKKEPKGGKRWKKNREMEDWWDTSVDPEGPYYPANRRSTDSYEDEYYECYDRPRRRRQGGGGGGGGGWQHGNQQTGGHSSSSRDVSPWEEEPRRREGRPGWGKHPRGHSFERHRDMKHVDSWDDDDDYEYDEEHRSRGHYFPRHASKDIDRHGGGGGRDMETDRWDDYGDRRYRRRRESSREPKESKDRWCCPDWEQEKSGRYPARRGNIPDRRERYDEKYRSSRESQDSPWEDEYSNDIEDSHSPHYVTKKTWKQRPSSASEMDRKTGEIKSRHYLGTGGSDGERDRRYKGARRSRSRDSQFNEHRHKSDAVGRPPHRLKPHKPLDADYLEMPPSKKELDMGDKKMSSLRRKAKESNSVGESIVSTFPRKATARAKSLFDNDFLPSDESPIIKDKDGKFKFDNDYENAESDLPVLNRSIKGLRQQSLFEKSQLRLDKSLKDRRSESFQESKVSPRYQTKPSSPFEDDFSPSEKPDHGAPEGNGISSIKEEPDLPEEEEEEDDSFGKARVNPASNGRRKNLYKNRLSGRTDVNLKKSGSVNIFSRENDPFDDEFFSGNAELEETQRDSELRWTEEFEDSDNGRK